MATTGTRQCSFGETLTAPTADAPAAQSTP
ncbi:hypothetical protein HNR07_003317 [Nocardiopsis metallicus]|uniref:Uncharacterized protein n=1 Tax=Nocardiopsis metallicus TaxID=179819 RepID=A0A840W5D3_9ACTN|nr:hypothetical protein [Nocardiopsis metallicus]